LRVQSVHIPGKKARDAAAHAHCKRLSLSLSLALSPLRDSCILIFRDPPNGPASFCLPCQPNGVCQVCQYDWFCNISVKELFLLP